MKILEKIKSIPELNFILLCSNVELNADQQNKIKNMSGDSLNWDLIYDIAQTQRVLPLLYLNLKKMFPQKVPSLIANKLKTFTIHNTGKNIYILSFLTSLLSLFKKNHIDIIPFKGLITAQDIYGDISLRAFSDIDILIKKKTALKAWLLLIDNGFEPELNLNPHQIKKYINVEDNISFFNTKNKLSVELHWEISGIYLPNPLLFEDIENRLDIITIEGREFKNLSPEDLLIYLCIHGAKHGWEYLEQICSVAELLKVKKELDWVLIRKLATRWRCTNILLLGLNLATTLFNAPVPDDINANIIKNKTTAEISETVLNHMFNTYHGSLPFFPPERFSNFHIKIRDNLSDKILYFLRLTFRPTKKEWLYFPVCAPLSFIHYFLRPIRLISTGVIEKNA